MFSKFFGSKKPVKSNSNSNSEPEKKTKSTIRNLLTRGDVRGIAGVTEVQSRQKCTTRGNVSMCPGLRVNISQNRTVNSKFNTNFNKLEYGTTYLFLIQYNSRSGQFSTRFTPVLSRQEIGSRHFLMANFSSPSTNFVVAAGEIKKTRTTIYFNLESGTFMMPIMQWYRKYLGTNRKQVEENVKNLVRNVINKNLKYTNQLLTPNVNLKYSNIEGTPGVEVRLPKRQKAKYNANTNVPTLVKLVGTGRQTRSKGPAVSAALKK